MAMRIYLQSVWGISSVGRALAWHARGHRFESGILHIQNIVTRYYSGFCCFNGFKVAKRVAIWRQILIVNL